MEDFRKLEFGLNLLVSNDGYLLEKGVSERAITHKLAEHLQKLFPEWNVDCEFNRNLDQPKTIDINPQELLHLMADRLEASYGELESRLNNISTPEERNDLMRQLRMARTEYLEELDIWVFILELADSMREMIPIYPDIIIHHRGTRDNHIVIEAKKSSNHDRKARLFDLVKLATLVSRREFKYKKGIFIDIPVGDDFRRFRSFERANSVFGQVFQYSARV